MKVQKIVEISASQINEENRKGWYIKQVIDHFVDRSGRTPSYNNHLLIVLMEKEI